MTDIREEQKQKTNVEKSVTSLGFDRLGAILHEIAKGAAKELNLENTEFYVYAIYNILRAPKEKQIKIKITKYRERLYEIMKNYKTQLCFRDTRLGWETLKRKVTERFGIFEYDEIGKFVNF